MNSKDGFLVINKEKGCTSHDCVREVRRLYSTKKVGHTGTLDPNVTGTLPIALGSATRFIQYLQQDKTYIGQIKLGIRTETDDIYGKILKKSEWPLLNKEQLETYLNHFRGNIKQVPPQVSSVHIDGERAYKKFLRGEQFELMPKDINIKELVLEKWDQVNGILDIKISCSSGTYIRSLARDLGIILNSEGCLLNLKRISACGFHAKDSIKISDLSNHSTKNKNFIIPTIFALNHISTFTLTNNEEIIYWKTGRAVEFNSNNFIESFEFEYKKPIKVIDREKNLLGIGFINDMQTTLHPKLVLNAK